MGENRTKRPTTGRCGLHLPSPLRGLRRTALAVSQAKAAVFNCWPCRGPTAPRPRPSSVGGNRTKRPATGSCGLHLPSPLAGAAPNRPRRFRNRRPQFPTAGRLRATLPHGRAGHRPWVEAAQNARQLEVAGFICQAPCGGCTEPPLAVSPLEGRSFQLPAASEPHCSPRPIPRPRPTSRASLAKPPDGGCTEPRLAVSPPEGRSFQLQAASICALSPSSFYHKLSTPRALNHYRNAHSIAQIAPGRMYMLARKFPS